MNSLMISINAIVPLCILVVIGYFIRNTGVVKEESFKDVNKLVFNLFIPMSLLNSIIKTNLDEIFQPKLILFSIILVIIIIILGVLIVPKFESDRKKQGTIIQALFRSNFVQLGVPIVSAIYGPENVGITSIVVAFLVPLFNVFAIGILQYYGRNKIELKSTLITVIKNPMIIATIIGIIILSTGINLPVFAETTISMIGKIASPLALIVLGISFKASDLKEDRLKMIYISLFRLVIIPIVAVALAVAIGYRGVELATLLVLFGGPGAVASYTMADVMGCDAKLAGKIIFVTTIGVSFTLFIGIFLLNNLLLL